MKNNLVKILDKHFYIFKNATEYEIKNTLPRDWGDKNIYFVNCDSNEKYMSVKDAEYFWKNK